MQELNNTMAAPEEPSAAAHDDAAALEAAVRGVSEAFKESTDTQADHQAAIDRTRKTYDFLKDAQDKNIATAYDYADVIATGSYQSEELEHLNTALAGSFTSTDATQ